MIIKRATPSEAENILRLAGKVMAESSMGYAGNNTQNAINMFLPLLQNGAYYLLAIENRSLAGWILLGSDFNLLKNEEIGTLLDLYVFSKYRKSGIGRKLMLAAIQDLQTQGLKTIQLNVFEGNSAKALYEELGFRNLSTIMEMKIP
ncbi:GNAT family N-acetyltransferase [Mesobacillus harenae]|uniref:GNAT family N-acetyltransferase n=1 Tax=Mesobacillus harenae TaxID=2213203 RepID=UPI00157FF585|nr:GNAT family N-acetyltransferase [Mesobacillus harenae]